jgi:hypothetical protein
MSKYITDARSTSSSRLPDGTNISRQSMARDISFIIGHARGCKAMYEAKALPVPGSGSGAPSLLTRLTEKAAVQNNEVPTSR